MSSDLPARRDESLRRLRTLTRLLDNAVPIPGTRYRFGLDALVGLVPGIGDAIGAIFSTYIILHAARLGVSRSTLFRMMSNVVLDTVVGEVPLLGDLFDVGWKSNSKNLALLEAHLQQPIRTRRASRLVLVLVAAGLLLLLVAVVALGVLAADLVVVRMR